MWSLIDTLIAVNCIAVSGDEYPTISLTPLGYEVAQGKKSIPLVLPPRRLMPEKKARSGKTNPSKKFRASKKARDKAPDDFTVSGPAVAVLKRLKDWRRRKAAVMGSVPAYIIYPDKTLKELAIAQPCTREDLLLIRGIGPAKVRQFGKETLKIIREATGSESDG